MKKSKYKAYNMENFGKLTGMRSLLAAKTNLDFDGMM